MARLEVILKTPGMLSVGQADEFQIRRNILSRMAAVLEAAGDLSGVGGAGAGGEVAGIKAEN